MVDTKHYISDIFISSYNDFIQDLKKLEFGRNRTLRLATILASRVKDLSEYLFNEKMDEIINHYSLTSPSKRENLKSWRTKISSNASFHLCCDISDASKHKVLDRKDRLIENIDAIVEKPTYVRFKDNLGYYYRLIKTININLISGKVVQADQILQEGSRIILSECIKFGIIDRLPTLEQSLVFPLKRINEEIKVKFDQLEGEKRIGQLGTMIYDYKKRKIRELEPGEYFNKDFEIEVQIQKSPFK